jgi:psp operon transcriptional activator
VREGDIGVLAEYFGRRMAAELDWDRWPGFAPHIMDALEDHLWPGNVRELRNVVERAVYRWGDFETPIAHVQFDPFDSPWRPRPPEHRRSSAPAASGIAPTAAAPVPAASNFDSIEDLRAAVDAHERAILAHALGKHRWNQRQTAKALGLTYDQLRHCIRKHGLMEGQEDSA